MSSPSRVWMSRTRPAWTNVRSIASTRAPVPCTSIRTNASIAVCPTEAIFYEDDLPDEWAWYKDAAVSFFAEVGDLGGASAAGPIGKDPEQVAALPPQNQ